MYTVVKTCVTRYVPKPVAFVLIKHSTVWQEAVPVVRVTCNRWCTGQSDATQGISRCAMAMILGTWSSKEVQEMCFIWFLWEKHASPSRIHHKLVQVYSDGTVRVQHVRKWCRQFKNGSMDIHDEDQTNQTSTSRMNANVARVEILILGH